MKAKRTSIVRVRTICVHTEKDKDGCTVINVKRPRRIVTVRTTEDMAKSRAVDTLAAIDGAAKLAEGLGDAWEARVWENLGWHFSAKLGRCEVYDNGGGPSARRYWANLNDTRNHGAFPQVHATGRTSREAVNKVIREAELIAARLSDAALELRG